MYSVDVKHSFELLMSWLYKTDRKRLAEWEQEAAKCTILVPKDNDNSRNRRLAEASYHFFTEQDIAAALQSHLAYKVDGGCRLVTLNQVEERPYGRAFYMVWLEPVRGGDIVNERYKLVGTDKSVPLVDCPPGLFLYQGTLGFKSTYESGHSHTMEVYCVASGEAFWGGTADTRSRAALMVTPVKVVSR